MITPQRHLNLVFFFAILVGTTLSVQGLNATFSDEKNPQIQLSETQLPSFRNVYIYTETHPQFYYVSADNLTEALTITAEYPLRVSTHCYDGFEQEIVLSPSGSGDISNVKIIVRGFPESTGDFQPAINHVSGDVSAPLTTHLVSTQSQIPPLYYSSATGTGEELKTQLANIIGNHQVQTYASLWSHFYSTDVRFDGKVWDIYSDIPCEEPPYLFTFGVDQDSGTGGTSEGDVYNREHSIPRSWYGSSTSHPMHTELYHVFPVDKHVNAVRENYPFGMVSNPTRTFENGAVMGNISVPGYSGLAYEPIDEYKGDLARAFLYVITRYESQIAQWTYSDHGTAMFDNQSYPGFKPWVVDMFLDWNQWDAVSQKERERNDLVHAIQGNRNPFVDNPDWIRLVWAPESVQDFDLQLTTNASLETDLVGANTYKQGQVANLVAPANDINGNPFMQWEFSDGKIASSFRVFSFFMPGKNTTLKAKYDTGDDTTQYINNFYENVIVLYPNPANAKVQLKSAMDLHKIEFIDMQGRVFQSDIVQGEEISIQISHLPQGIYMLRVHTPDGVHYQRMVISR